MHPAAIGQMARAVINTIRKRVKSAQPASGRGSGGLSRVRSKRGGKAGARARRRVALGPVRSKRGGKSGTRARRIAKRMVKGSAAARQHMAKLRRMRKKKR